MKAKRRAAGLAKVCGCAILLAAALFPIYWLVAMAIRETEEMQGQIPLIPQSLTVEHFSNLFLNEGFGQATLNSLQTTLSSLVLSLVIGVCAAYIIARRRFQNQLKKPLTYACRVKAPPSASRKSAQARSACRRSLNIPNTVGPLPLISAPSAPFSSSKPLIRVISGCAGSVTSSSTFPSAPSLSTLR